MSSIGIISPEARWETSKYGAAIRPAVATLLADKPSPPLPLGLDPHFDDLVAASRSRATWQKYECGWRAFQQFELRVGGKFAWPLDVGAVRGFITWCTFERKIKPDTIRTYLSALSMAHKLKGLAHPPSLDDELSKLALDGAARIPTAAPPPPPQARSPGHDPAPLEGLRAQPGSIRLAEGQHPDSLDCQHTGFLFQCTHGGDFEQRGEGF